MAFADDVKTYCNTDDDLTKFINAAEASLAIAGIAKAEENPLYAQAVQMMVSCWYDNRVPDPANKAVNVPQPYGLAGIILQLQMSQGAT